MYCRLVTYARLEKSSAMVFSLVAIARSDKELNHVPLQDLRALRRLQLLQDLHNPPKESKKMEMVQVPETGRQQSRQASTVSSRMIIRAR